MISYAFSKSIKEKNTIKMSHGVSCVNKKVVGCCFLSNKKKSKGPVAFYPERKKRIITKQKGIKNPGVFCTQSRKLQLQSKSKYLTVFQVKSRSLHCISLNVITQKFVSTQYIQAATFKIEKKL